MRAFTVHGTQDDDGVIEALRIRTHIAERAPRLTIGDERTSFSDLPVSTHQRALFLKALDEGTAPVGPTGMAELWLNHAVFNGERLGQEPRITEFSRRRVSNDALVHIEVPAAPGGKLWYEGTSYTERVDRERVVRDYAPFPSPGIEVLATGTGQENEPHMLIRMMPAASIRICRNGQLPPELSPVIMLVWTGSRLRCFAPAKFRPQQAHAA